MNKIQRGVRLLVLTAGTTKIAVIWDVTSFSLEDSYQTA
jgi:hypothetical protein